jgi:hypothetical protein
VNANLTSSAQIVSGMRLPSSFLAEDWQAEAWAFYDSMGELRFASNWMGNACSRALLVPSLIPGTPGDDPAPDDSPVGEQALAMLGGGAAGQAQVLLDIAIHLFVAGASYLVGEPAEDDPEGEGPLVSWNVYSTDDIASAGADSFRVRDESTPGGYRSLSPAALVVRIWRPHPRWRWQADAPTRAALPALREVALLSGRVRAEALSRLAGAGVFVVPSEASLPPTRDPVTGAEVHRDLLDVLVESMTVPIGDPESASAVVPLLLRVPGALADAVRHVSFATPFDERIIELRDSAIRRVATSLDMPAEVLLGLGESNHWSAWQIEEAAVTIHVEPTLDLMCYGLTVGFYRPVLEALGVADVEGRMLWYDSSALRLRPDRSEDAVGAYDRLLIGTEATRREVGFDETDAPAPAEFLRMLGVKLALADPANALVYLRMGGIDVGAAVVVAPSAPAAPPALPAAPEAPAAPGPPAAGPPASPPEPAQLPSGEAAVEAGLVAACDALVLRALERAEARSRTLEKNGKECSLDDLLHAAWDRVPEVAARYSCDPDPLRTALDAYTRGLLLYEKPYAYADLALALGAYVALPG